MSNKALARRADAEVYFGGVDISTSVRNHLISLSYTDNEEDEADDLQIKLQDRDGIWLTQWLDAAVQAAASYNPWLGKDEGAKPEAESDTKGLSVQAIIVRKNWGNDGNDDTLDCGEFELDSLDASGPPAEVNIKCTSLPYSAPIRQTKKSRAWEGYTLSGIAREMAVANKMSCLFESATDPRYERLEQIDESDISFLSTLCHNEGISLKATNRIIVLFDQAEYEAKDVVKIITRGDGSYLKYKLSTGAADTMYACCRVSYTNPNTGAVISATAYVEDYSAGKKENQTLEITAKVNSVGEAQHLAEKMLRMKNKYEYGASFTFPGDTGLVAGVTVSLCQWGAWDGKYIVKQAKHSLGGSGYTTQLSLRRVLEDN